MQRKYNDDINVPFWGYVNLSVIVFGDFIESENIEKKQKCLVWFYVFQEKVKTFPEFWEIFVRFDFQYRKQWNLNPILEQYLMFISYIPYDTKAPLLYVLNALN